MKPVRTAAVIAVAWLALGGAVLAATPTATVEQGRLVGVEMNDVDVFLSLPYARPPVGDLRWRAPRPPQSWTGVRQATAFGLRCTQPAPQSFGPYTAEYLDRPPFGEDCLTLNVWTPVHRTGPVPVVVWIHGGGFMGGSGAVDVYNGVNLARQDVVVVSINYRLGPFGYLAHPLLTAESPRHTSGNYGLQDAVAALTWVKANISAFGGDPTNVTVDGQSAGAAMVNELLVSPGARGLFVRAIAESGSGMGMTGGSLKDAEAAGLDLGRRLNAPTPAALRAAPAEAIMAALPSPFPEAGRPRPPNPFIPVVDGVVLPGDPDDPATPAVAQTPMITGFNMDEAMAAGATHATPAEFEATVRTRYGPVADRLLALYPHADEAAASDSARLLARDRYMAALVIWAETRTRATGQPIYAYLYDHAEPGPQAKVFGAFHSSEIPYVFGNLLADGRTFGEADQAVSRQMAGYWVGFMWTGRPQASGQPEWRPLRPGTGLVMELGDHPGPRPAVSSPKRLQALRDYVAGGGRLSLF